MIYYYPNRPLLLSTDQLAEDKWGGWAAERKYNGDRLMLHYENGEFKFYGRQRELLCYKPPKSLLNELAYLQLPDKTILDGELMHKHTKDIKDTIFFYDVYVLGGVKRLEPFTDRRQTLKHLLQRDLGWEAKHLKMAEQWAATGLLPSLKDLFNHVTKDQWCEGLVLKDRNGRIVWNTIKSDDVPWQVKFRKHTKSYQF